MAWAPDYVSTIELADFLRVQDSLDDLQLIPAIAAASRAVDKATGRQFGVVDEAEARYFTARYSARPGRWVVPIDDLMTTTGLVVDVDTDGDETFADEITDYILRPRNAAPADRPWTELAVPNSSTVSLPTTFESVRITARWGWTEVPDAVKQATLLQASRLIARRNSPFGVAGSPEAGNELRLLARVDPDVEVSLAPYRRRRGVVFA